MNKITIFTENTERSDWLMQRNEIIVSGLEAVEPKYCAETIGPLCGALRTVLKTNMRVAMATFESVDAFGNSIEFSSGFATAFARYEKLGEVARDGEMYYRDVVRINQYARSGRSGHLWFRGMLDERDIVDLGVAGRASRYAPSVIDTLRASALGYGTNILDNMWFVSRKSGLRECVGLTSYYTDSHAATRWRRRTKGALVNASREVFSNIEALAKALEESRYWTALGIRIAPGAVQHNMVGAVAMCKATAQAVQQASEAGSDGAEGGQSEPHLRFGIAWDGIIEGWNYAKGQADQPIQDLQQAKPTHYESGDEYIEVGFLTAYEEFLENIIQRVALSANADWFNPLAYEGQISELELRRLPDIIELAF